MEPRDAANNVFKAVHESINDMGLDDRFMTVLYIIEHLKVEAETVLSHEYHRSLYGKGTCTADETRTLECVRDDMGGYGKRLTVHEMECSECGHTYEHVNGDYEYCPRCGRKRADA